MKCKFCGTDMRLYKLNRVSNEMCDYSYAHQFRTDFSLNHSPDFWRDITTMSKRIYTEEQYDDYVSFNDLHSRKKLGANQRIVSILIPHHPMMGPALAVIETERPFMSRIRTRNKK